jgi:hypothetical protein
MSETMTQIPMTMADRDVALSELSRTYGRIVDQVHHDGQALHLPTRMAEHLAAFSSGALALRQARALAQARLNHEREALLREPYTHPVATIDQREGDLINWLGLMAMANQMISAGHGATEIALRDARNVTLSLPATAIVTLLTAAAEHRSAIMAASWSAKSAIQAADSVEAVEAVMVTAWAGLTPSG